jgi:DNA repair ATPase RecN
MPKINFKLSDDAKFSALWALLNPEFNEEGNWTISYGISAVYDDYALAVNYETGEMNRVYYTKNDENDMVELGEIVKCYIVDVTESEKSTLDTLRSLNGNTYELVSDVLTNAQENFEKVSDFSIKIEELNETVSTLTTERDNANTQIGEYSAQLESANSTIESLNGELESLKDYKLNVENKQKEAVIEEYSEHLSEETLNTYRAKISEYSAEELDMRLAYELKKSNSSIFAKNNDEGFVPKDVPTDGLTAILSKYKK